MFALLWQMEMEGTRPEGSACGDGAEKGAFILPTPPPGGGQIRDKQSPGPALGTETQKGVSA